MGRTIKSKVKIEEIYFDEDLYPRSTYNWQTGYDYSESMKAGAKFPPVILALFKGKKYLVDGKHRIEAYKLNKVKIVEAVVYTNWNRKKIFLEAVKANITHGRGLSPYEKRRIALKLKEMNLKEKEISSIIQVPQNKLQNFVGDRLINSITGEVLNPEESEKISKEIGQAILKSGIKHFAGQSFPEEEYREIEGTQKKFYAKSQESLLEELISIVEKNLIDRKNQNVINLIEKLKKLFKVKGL